MDPFSLREEPTRCSGRHSSPNQDCHNKLTGHSSHLPLWEALHKLAAVFAKITTTVRLKCIFNWDDFDMTR